MLSKQSGLPDFYLSAICAEYMDKYDRFPNLDEIPGANSKPYLSKQLKLDKNNFTEVSNILELTNTSSIEEAVIKLNKNFADLEIEIMPLDKEALVNITNRPVTQQVQEKSINHSKSINNQLLFEDILYKLQKLYGINVNPVTTQEISEQFKNVPGIISKKAFVHNGEIYINTNLASIDSPIHEMMHILMGSIRFSNPELYFSITNAVANSEIFEFYKEQNPNRTLSDVAEEAFIEEFAKLISNSPSNLPFLSNKIQYELQYHAKRVLDTILMGESSIKDYDNKKLFNNSLSSLANLVNSTIDVNNFKGTISIENGGVNRLLSNIKQELFEKKELEEYCQ